MRSVPKESLPRPRRAFRLAPVLAAATVLAGAASAQEASPGDWRLGATAGMYAPRSALILSADGDNTRLGAAPAFGLELQYLASRRVAVYGGGQLAFSRITLGSAIVPSVTGPSDQVMLLAATGGVLLTIPAEGWLGEHLQPTVRLGGGVKWYSLDLAGARDQWRATADLGVGFRGVGAGPLEISAEVRYLPSSFSQGRLPIRGIAPQDQRQNDLLLSIGVAVRP